MKLTQNIKTLEDVRENFKKIGAFLKNVIPGAAKWGEVDGNIDDQADLSGRLNSLQAGINTEASLREAEDDNLWLGIAGKEDAANKKTAWGTPDNEGYPTTKLVKDSLDGKQDKEAGKGLSQENYTTEEKGKLASITAIFTTALKTVYDNAVAWVSANGQNILNHLTNTNNPHNTTAAQLGAAVDSNVVHKTGNETVGGEKTFSNKTGIGVAPTEVLTVGTTNATPATLSLRTNNGTSRSIFSQNPSTGGLELKIDAGANGSARVFDILMFNTLGLRINWAGKVGIGIPVTGASEKLEINGNIKIGTVVIIGDGPRNSILGMGNSIDPNCKVSNISGGGESPAFNKIGAAAKPYYDGATPLGWSVDTGYVSGSANYSTIGGGYDHIANQLASVIMGGGHNFIKYNAEGHSIIGGGSYNVISAGRSGIFSGSENVVSGENIYSVITGGFKNVISGSYSGVFCGREITITGSNSFAAGVKINAIGNGLTVFTDAVSTDILTVNATNTFVARYNNGFDLMGGALRVHGVATRTQLKSGFDLLIRDAVTKHTEKISPNSLKSLLATTSMRYALATGTNAYTATFTPEVTAYILGDSFVIGIPENNGGNVTLRLSPSLPFRQVVNDAGGQLPANTLKAGGQYVVTNTEDKIQLIGEYQAPAVPTTWDSITGKPADITLMGNAFNGPSQLVLLDSGSRLPAVDGSQLTNLPGAEIDDTTPSANKVYSSEKTQNEIDFLDNKIQAVTTVGNHLFNYYNFR